ncbi:hypothetical protein ABT354_26800 [Streptomyces sp. NPDC000594]|uniref:hypothetical protein n=1 Tax=Streptomyces sp. NPDC000594 TaxID=3154261 RepID=UPI00331ECF65
MAGDIWLGDLAGALSLAAPDDRERQRTIAALLGFAPRDPAAYGERPAAPEPDGEPEPGNGTPGAPAGEPEPAPEPAGEPEPGAPEPPAEPAEGAAAVRLLTPVAQVTPPPEEWGTASLPTARAGPGSPVPPHEPLFAPRSSAALVQTAVARVVAEGEPDIPRIVGRLARGHALTRVPLLPVATLRFGVQILVDLGAGMAPFARDRTDLVDQVRAVVGRDRTRVRYFEDAPLRGTGDEARWSWGPYTPPTRGTRVLVLSDLGIGGPAVHPRRSTPDEWRELARVVERAGCRVTAFVPCPPRRVPAWAAATMDVVPWDRPTTVGRVRRLLLPTGDR